MSRCGPWVADDKPRVWRDAEGLWHVSQTTSCRKCGDLDWGASDEYDTWVEALTEALANPKGATR